MSEVLLIVKLMTDERGIEVPNRIIYVEGHQTGVVCQVINI
jgi:hypothetical protein